MTPKAISPEVALRSAAQQRGGDAGDERCGLVHEGGAAFGRIHVVAAAQLLDQEARQRLGAGRRLAEGVGAFGADEGVGVVFGRQEQEGQRRIVAQGFQRVLQRPPGGATARSVAVEAEHDAVGLAQQRVHVLRRGSGAERGDGVGDAELRQRDDVHVAFDDDGEAFVADRLLRQVKAVEFAPLLEQRRFRRVQILRLALVQDAAAEGDDAATAVMDRKDDAIAEAVVAPPLVVVDDQAGFGQDLCLVVRKDLLQRLPVVGGVAEAEARGDFARQAAALQVIDGAAGGLELIVVEACSQAHCLVEAFAAVVLRAGAASVVGDLQADLGGEFLHRVDEAEPAVFHQEAECAAMHAAAEAVIELLGRADRERSGFLAVERAAGEVVRTALLQRDVAFDDVDDIDARQQFLNEGLGNHRTRP